ncbi:MAG: hypothetical protein SGPRY_000892 [Prymnesium sp.]
MFPKQRKAKRGMMRMEELFRADGRAREPSEHSISRRSSSLSSGQRRRSGSARASRRSLSLAFLRSRTLRVADAEQAQASAAVWHVGRRGRDSWGGRARHEELRPRDATITCGRRMTARRRVRSEQIHSEQELAPPPLSPSLSQVQSRGEGQQFHTAPSEPPPSHANKWPLWLPPGIVEHTTTLCTISGTESEKETEKEREKASLKLASSRQRIMEADSNHQWPERAQQRSRKLEEVRRLSSERANCEPKVEDILSSPSAAAAQEVSEPSTQGGAEHKARRALRRLIREGSPMRNCSDSIWHQDAKEQGSSVFREMEAVQGGEIGRRVSTAHGSGRNGLSRRARLRQLQFQDAADWIDMQPIKCMVHSVLDNGRRASKADGLDGKDFKNHSDDDCHAFSKMQSPRTPWASGEPEAKDAVNARTATSSEGAADISTVTVSTEAWDTKAVTLSEEVGVSSAVSIPNGVGVTPPVSLSKESGDRSGDASLHRSARPSHAVDAACSQEGSSMASPLLSHLEDHNSTSRPSSKTSSLSRVFSASTLREEDKLSCKQLGECIPPVKWMMVSSPTPEGGDGVRWGVRLKDSWPTQERRRRAFSVDSAWSVVNNLNSKDQPKWYADNHALRKGALDRLRSEAEEWARQQSEEEVAAKVRRQAQHKLRIASEQKALRSFARRLSTSDCEDGEVSISLRDEESMSTSGPKLPGQAQEKDADPTAVVDVEAVDELLRSLF